METTYLNAETTSKLLNVSKSTIYAYVGKNKIPFIKLGGKLLFSETDLNKWIDSMKSEVSTNE